MDWRGLSTEVMNFYTKVLSRFALPVGYV